MARVDAARPSLDGERFDVAVIGGGINGVAIARECAKAGRRTLLLDQNDFASGTTSRSTRIIHGGLRYLEHGELSLVRESLRERGRLLRERPHLVRPVRFLLALPQNSRHSALAVRAGLWLYSSLAGGKNSHCPNQESVLLSGLDSGEQWSTFNYEDAQCEFPERLVAEWLTEAVSAGAVVRNHCRVLEVVLRNGDAEGVVVCDQLSGAEHKVVARWIINASGPWVDRVCAGSGLRQRRPLVGGVRGSHLVVLSFAAAPKSAIYVESRDGRQIFVIPWNGRLLVGTTEIADDRNPEHASPSASEINYLLKMLADLFPSRQFGSSDVQLAFAGIRPLPYSPGKSVGAITRRHLLHDHSDEGARGLISVVGGKLTTAASLARECAYKIGVQGRDVEPQHAAIAPADGIESSLRQWSQLAAGIAQVSAATALGFAEWYGRRALCVARFAAKDASLRQPICEHATHVVAEAVYAAHAEFAASLADVLLRRVPLALGACWSAECSATAAQRIGEALGWAPARIAQELEGLEAERIHFLPPVNTSSHQAVVDLRSERAA